MAHQPFHGSVPNDRLYCLRYDMWVQMQDNGDVLIGATSFGIFVTLDALYVEGLVHITELGGEYFKFDEARQELRGERTGIKHAVGGLELGRINVAARGCGIAMGALRDAVRYAQERQTFGKPIAQHQAIQLKLADMATRVEASKLLIEQAARKYDTGERCDLEAGMAKLFASEAGVENSLEAMRIFGGYSYSTDFDVERYYRDAPLMCIGEGTNEILRQVIAKQLIARYPI